MKGRADVFGMIRSVRNRISHNCILQVLLAQGGKSSGTKPAPDNGRRAGEPGSKNQKKKAPLVCEVREPSFSG